MIRNKKVYALISATLMSTAFSLGTSINIKTVSAYEIKKFASLYIENEVKNGDVLEETLNELINEKIITKEQADKILTYLKGNSKNSNTNNSKNEKLFDELVKNNIVTEELAEKIRDRMGDKIFVHKKDEISQKLDDLIKNNTINEEQKNKVLNKLEEAHKERRENCKKLKGMSDKERKEYIEKNNLHNKDILEELLKEGVITKEQAEAIKKIIPRNNMN